jgi:hypothetical protein
VNIFLILPIKSLAYFGTEYTANSIHLCESREFHFPTTDWRRLYTETTKNFRLFDEAGIRVDIPSLRQSHRRIRPAVILFITLARHFIAVLRASTPSRLTRAWCNIASNFNFETEPGGFLPARTSGDNLGKLDSRLAGKIIAAGRITKVACENVNSDDSRWFDFPVFRIYSNLTPEILE